jgi:hypothetical protein
MVFVRASGCVQEHFVAWPGGQVKVFLSAVSPRALRNTQDPRPSPAFNCKKAKAEANAAQKDSQSRPLPLKSGAPNGLARLFGGGATPSH